MMCSALHGYTPSSCSELPNLHNIMSMYSLKFQYVAIHNEKHLTHLKNFLVMCIVKIFILWARGGWTQTLELVKESLLVFQLYNCVFD